MLRNAKRAANIGKSSRYAESATSTPKSPIAMNSVLWLPRTPGHRPPRHASIQLRWRTNRKTRKLRRRPVCVVVTRKRVYGIALAYLFTIFRAFA